MVKYKFQTAKNYDLICYKINDKFKNYRGTDAINILNKIKNEEFDTFNTTIKKEKNNIKYNIKFENNNVCVLIEDVFGYNASTNVLKTVKEMITKIELKNLSKKKKALFNAKKSLTKLALAGSLIASLFNVKELNKHEIAPKIEFENSNDIINEESSIIQNLLETKNYEVLNFDNNLIYSAYKDIDSLNNYSNINIVKDVTVANIDSKDEVANKVLTTKIEQEDLTNQYMTAVTVNLDNTTVSNNNIETINEITTTPTIDEIMANYAIVDETNTIEEEIVSPEELDYTPNYNGPVLTSTAGRITGPTGGEETYYDLDMAKVVQNMRNKGFSEEEYPYWIREDGCKMLGNYVMIAANLNVHPRGSFVPTSLGTGLVCDTGSFAKTNPNQIDIATNWTKHRSR